MIVASCLVMGSFMVFAFAQAAMPNEAVLIQYGALGAMCIFLMSLVVWLLRVGVKLVSELEAVVKANTAEMARVHEVVQNCTRGARHGD